MSALEITSDTENKLLSRRELTCIFKGAGGLLTRQGATEAIAARVGVAKDNVKIISLRGSFGVRDLRASAYVFSDPEAAKRQLREYMWIRQLPKDERKKALEEKKKAKAPSPGGSAHTGSQPSAEKKP